MDMTAITQQRAEKDHFFKTHAQSPLTPAQRAQFDGLRYFPPDPALTFTVAVRRYDKADNVPIQTTTGQTKWYLRYGEVTVSIEGTSARLTLYKAPPDHFFLPFVDALAGELTYPAGRYLEPVLLDDGRCLIDFNRAYNPYCAYGDGWNCPITPAENRLSLPIRAGEKLPEGAWINGA